MMDYIELKCSIEENTDAAREVLTAELGNMGYESFQDWEGGLLAYIPLSDFDFEVLEHIYCVSHEIFGNISFTYQLFKDKNWNEYWEKNFQPVIIQERLIIKAPFHKIDQKFEYELILEPKMSFGTGHHATTWLMLAAILDLKLDNAHVLDIGCGTGILSVFARMRGAKKMVGFDNNDWAYNNALENIKLNDANEVEIMLGEISNLQLETDFDFVLANINRNVILEEMQQYISCMKKGGEILFSGILIENFPEVNEAALKHGLELMDKRERDKWILLHYKKPD